MNKAPVAIPSRTRLAAHVFAGIFALSAGLANADASASPRELFDKAIALREREASADLAPDAAQAVPAPAAPASESAGKAASPDTANARIVTSSGLFDASAEGYEALASGDDRYFREAASARWWAGRIELAIVDLRLYLSRHPFDTRALDDLAEMRKSAGLSDPGDSGPAGWPWTLWFLYALSVSTGAGILCGGIFLFTRRRGARAAAIACAALALCAATAFAIGLRVAPRVAVILSETQGRKGDSDLYARSPDKPWGKGQEGVVIETRDGWTCIQAGGELSWVPGARLRVIEP